MPWSVIIKLGIKMCRSENRTNEPLPLNLLFIKGVRENRRLPPIEFCPDCGTWHDCLNDCIMKKEKNSNDK